jgi:hypothetical protein
MTDRAHVVFAKIKGRSRDTGAGMPVYGGDIQYSETLTVSASPQTTSISAPDQTFDVFADITTETSCWVATGATPAPGSNPRWLLLANQSLTLRLKSGDKVAVVAA